jgi:hypothetical protein
MTYGLERSLRIVIKPIFVDFDLILSMFLGPVPYFSRSEIVIKPIINMSIR